MILHSNVAQDAYGYALGYYWNGAVVDYKPINNAAESLYDNADDITETNDDLFNGNIKEMSTALMKPNGASIPDKVALICNHYRYDQLNRITQQTSFTGASTMSYNSLSSTGEYTNKFVYDAAGNIQQQFRNGNTAAGQSMDSLTYHYYKSTVGHYKANADGSAPVNGTNKLNFVDDNGTSANYGDDLEDQSAGNYEYDGIGNLTKDVSEGIEKISWNVYGKIDTIARVPGWSYPGSSPAEYPSDLEFIYDAFGNRIVKIVKPNGALGQLAQRYWEYTYYTRDASGNVMSTYKRTWTEISGTVEDDKLELRETHLYGGTRLGIKAREAEGLFSQVRYNYSGMNVDGSYNTTTIASTTFMNVPDLATPERTLGYKQYEFSNHLGNVLVTLSDRKIQVQNVSSVDYFMADVRSYSDYSAFGAQLPGRSANSSDYRYGQNSQEKDNEIAEGIYSATYWEYDSRLGRRWNVDPKPDASLSVYAAFANNPIWFTDVAGDTIKFAAGTSAEFQQQYMEMVSYLRAHDAAGVIDDLEASTAITYVTDLRTDNPLHQGGSYFDPNNSTIYWNPTKLSETQSGNHLSATVIFVHEASHALLWATDPAQYKIDAATLDPVYGNLAERKAITGVETIVARQLGEIGPFDVAREDHFSQLYDAFGPTSTVIDESNVVTITAAKPANVEQPPQEPQLQQPAPAPEPAPDEPK